MQNENAMMTENEMRMTHQKHDENKEILKLFEEGYSPQEIARQLNKGIGEVQLICNLAKR